MVTAIAVTPLSANAADAVPDRTPISASKDAVLNLEAKGGIVDEMPVVPASEVAELTRIAVASNLRKTTGALDSSNARGLVTGGDVRAIRIPVAPDANPTGQSALTVFFGSDGTILSWVEMQFEPIDATSGRVQVWNDGSLRMNEVVSDPGSAGESAAVASRATYKKGDWWGNLSTCLSGAGINGWVITGLGLACGVACAVTAGIGCGVCLAAAIGGASGTVTGCVAIANKYS